VLAEDLDLAERAFEALRPFRQECAATGLMGSVWCGPVAFELGRLALALGRTDEAADYLDTALEVANRMRSRPFVARIEAVRSRLAAATGNDEGARKHRKAALDLAAALEMRPIPGLVDETPPRKVVSAANFTMSPKGEVCEVALNGQKALVKNSRGIEMLTRLIGQPETDFHVLELSGSGSSGAIADSDAGPALDPKARAEYRQRVRELEEEMEEANDLGDISRLDGLREELDFISRELSRAFGLGGRERPQGKAAERARVNVRRRIKDAIERIEEQLPGAGRYLDNTIKTGSYCRYSPM
jgi:tetratricopeptide (TPR) repeat protein